MHTVDGLSGGAGYDRGRRILIVDDHNDVRESLGDLLVAAGFEVARAEAGQRALDYLLAQDGTEAPDAILLDFSMGDMTGTDFLAMKAAWPALAHIPVILVSGDCRAAAAAAAAACECLGKPLDLDDLLAALERQTSGRASQR